MNVGAFIWRMNHDLADGRIKATKEEIQSIDEDIMNIRKDQLEAVKQTIRFGVEQPVIGDNNAPTEKYWAWFRAWDSYIEGLSEEEWKILKQKIDNGEDCSEYRPKKIF